MTELRSSAIYRGTVRHRRMSPAPNQFTYSVFQLLLDLDELPQLDRGLRLFRYNRPGVLSFRDRDHFGAADLPLRTKVSQWLARQGLETPRGRMLLLTNPRILGYVFNPVSYVYCLDGDGRVVTSLAEVNNTFGDSYAYILQSGGNGAGDGDARIADVRTEKRLHVSPFIPIDGVEYRWKLGAPGKHLTVHIDEYESGEKFFDATLQLRREPLTDGGLARALIRYPHQTARTVWRIHWQALKVWLKRVPFHTRPTAPDNSFDP